MIISDGKLSDLIDFIYLNLNKNLANMDFMVSRAILTSKNNNVEYISIIIMDQYLNEFHTYPNVDSVDLENNGNMNQPQLYVPEFLRSLQILNLLPSDLRLKVKVLIILI